MACRWQHLVDRASRTGVAVNEGAVPASEPAPRHCTPLSSSWLISYESWLTACTTRRRIDDAVPNATACAC
jgi:hypothetical protein